MLSSPGGFLPAEDPLARFGDDSEFAPLDELGRDLPSLLQDEHFRAWPADCGFPLCPTVTRRCPCSGSTTSGSASWPRPTSTRSGRSRPRSCRATSPFRSATSAARLDRPPILSYDGYALYNWKRFDPAGPIALGNIDTIQNFVHLYDEHWFILVHVEIEALAAAPPGGDQSTRRRPSPPATGQRSTAPIGRVVRDALGPGARRSRRIPEKMDPALYYKTFRPYIRFFEGVVYEGMALTPVPSCWSPNAFAF